MNKYINIFKFNLKSQLNFKANYIFSLFSFALHIFVFNSLWEYLLKDKQILGYSKSELIWYVIIGELIIHTTSHNYRRISAMVKNGDIANMLTKPINFTSYLLAEEFASLIKVIVNIACAILLGMLMAEPIEITLFQLVIVIISGLLSVLIIILIEVAIGLLAFITEENEPFYIIISKFMLLFVFTPIEFYSETIQKVLYCMPTTYVVYPVSKLFVHFDITQTKHLLIGQVITLIGVILVIIYLTKKGVRNVSINGG